MRQEGIEPPTYSLEGCCSIQLSYWRFDEHKEPLGPSRSGRPDLNRGPPAPKAGAIPGYATPRETTGKLLYPAFRAQRGEQLAKRARTMTHGCSIAQRRFGEGSAEIG